MLKSSGLETHIHHHPTEQALGNDNMYSALVHIHRCD